MNIKIRSKLSNIYSRKNVNRINLNLYKEMKNLFIYNKPSSIYYDKINEDELYNTIDKVLSSNSNKLSVNINDYIIEYYLNLNSMICRNIIIKKEF